ncbi:hypothetical protein BCR32DRAFT_328036 [Anaeromyces robustus]|uniref:Uncharacterized protein n=1 Tax=Anaeromyces robustus TaxID=1754192 RepID=A0A1Y1X1K3_9FUNG|nr:hypothetical protein BCR32DRAFT_328036 [Anaeromyces robustus]|eukprot:ORX79653.1 hypothetical protein BCR32DRAFT_328036 [Anaeromyces robustus]
MKYITKFLTLFVGTTLVVSKKIYKRDDPDFISVYNSLDNSGYEFTLPSESNVSPECLDAIHKGCTLVSKFDSTQLTETCYDFNKSTCEVFLNEPSNKLFGNIQGCKNDDPNVLTQFYSEYMDLFDFVKNMCVSDENGKLCPHLEYFTFNDFYLDSLQITEEIVKKYVDASCYSKKCTENLIEGFESYINTHDEDEYKNNNKYIEDGIKQLKSKDCKSGNKPSSDATTIKYTSSLLISIGIFLLALL